MLPKIRKLLFEIQFQQNQSPYQGKNPDIFLIKFQQLRQAIIGNLQQFIPVDVVPKQPPSYLIPCNSKFSTRTYLDTKKNKIIQFPRKKSFQIYVDNLHLFSRLQSGSWPNVNEICEWALRMAEKIVDNQIQRQENPSNSLTGSSKQGQQQANNEKFPPVTQRTQRNKPERATQMKFYQRQRYSSLREDEAFLPYGVQTLDYAATKRIPSYRKKKMNSFDNKQLKTITHKSRSNSREQGFHWHLKNNNKVSPIQAKYNKVFINTFQIPERSPELSPLPAVHQKKIQSIKNEAYFEQKNNKIQIKLSKSELNFFASNYLIEGNIVTKTKLDSFWSPILSESPLPLSGQYNFSIVVKASKKNMIQLGIAPLTYYPNADSIQKDCLLSYNCGNGFIKDTRHNTFGAETFWREGGLQSEQKIPFQFKASINMKRRSIEWFINSQVVASALIPNIFMNGFRAFISLYSCKDVICLNQDPPALKSIIPQKSIIINETKSSKEKWVDNFAQTADEKIPILPLIQHRIYPRPMFIDQITQTKLPFEGRIRKQKLESILQKKISEKVQKQFSHQDLEKINIRDLQELQKKEELPHNNQIQIKLTNQQQIFHEQTNEKINLIPENKQISARQQQQMRQEQHFPKQEYQQLQKNQINSRQLKKQTAPSAISQQLQIIEQKQSKQVKLQIYEQKQQQIKKQLQKGVDKQKANIPQDIEPRNKEKQEQKVQQLKLQGTKWIATYIDGFFYLNNKYQNNLPSINEQSIAGALQPENMKIHQSQIKQNMQDQDYSKQIVVKKWKATYKGVLELNIKNQQK